MTLEQLNQDKAKSLFEIKGCAGGEYNCPNLILAGEELARQLKKLLITDGLVELLAIQEGVPILPHLKFKIGIAACPNACSRPQIRDLSLVARQRVEILSTECIGCGECVSSCKEGAIKIKSDSTEQNKVAVLDYNLCLDCGNCVSSCVVEAIQIKGKAWSFAIGGKMGRHPQFATKLKHFLATEVVLEKFVTLLEYYSNQRQGIEKLANLFNRLGKDKFEII